LNPDSALQIKRLREEGSRQLEQERELLRQQLAREKEAKGTAEASICQSNVK